MSNLSLFLKKNKVTRENALYPVTKSLLDEEGNPLKWEFRPLTSREDKEIRESCTKEVPVTGKPGMYRPRLDTDAYMAKMVVASCVNPNLNNAELQDSYGVKKPEDLLQEMVDDPGEYQDLYLFVQRFNGFNISASDKVEEVKN